MPRFSSQLALSTAVRRHMQKRITKMESTRLLSCLSMCVRLKRTFPGDGEGRRARGEEEGSELKRL